MLAWLERERVAFQVDQSRRAVRDRNVELPATRTPFPDDCRSAKRRLVADSGTRDTVILEWRYNEGPPAGLGQAQATNALLNPGIYRPKGVVVARAGIGVPSLQPGSLSVAEPLPPARSGRVGENRQR